MTKENTLLRVSKMTKENTLLRVSIPGKIHDLIWNDEEFYNVISQNKKAITAGKFPKYDQWCSDDGLHMAFALAGYSSEDVIVSIKGSELTVCSKQAKTQSDEMSEIESTLEFVKKLNEVVQENKENGDGLFPTIETKKPSFSVSMGVIVRGIARRSFKTRFVLNEMFDLSMTKASMKNGLLEIVVPKKEHETKLMIVEIKEN